MILTIEDEVEGKEGAKKIASSAIISSKQAITTIFWCRYYPLFLLKTPFDIHIFCAQPHFTYTILCSHLDDR